MTDGAAAWPQDRSDSPVLSTLCDCSISGPRRNRVHDLIEVELGEFRCPGLQLL